MPKAKSSSLKVEEAPSQNPQTSEPKPTPPTHPLLTQDIRPISNWHEWLIRFQVVETLEGKLGLIHTGFNMPLERMGYAEKNYDETDRIIFYLSVADGWNDYDLLKIPGDEGKEYRVGRDKCGNILIETPCGIRKIIAQKAFNLLCLNFFKMDILYDVHRERFNDEWRDIVVSKRLFPVIQNFFRAEKRWDGEVYIFNLSNNDDKSHNGHLAINFLLNLARFIWEGWKERDLAIWKPTKCQIIEEHEKNNAELRSRRESAKLWMIEVLSHLNQLGVLRKWLLQLTKPEVTKLKEIAMRKKFTTCTEPIYEDRPVESIEEAFFLGSSAARLLKEYEQTKATYDILDKRHDLKQKKKEIERAEEELSAKK